MPALDLYPPESINLKQTVPTLSKNILESGQRLCKLLLMLDGNGEADTGVEESVKDARD
jgi:hypothetical protein